MYAGGRYGGARTRLKLGMDKDLRGIWNHFGEYFRRHPLSVLEGWIFECRAATRDVEMSYLKGEKPGG